MCAIFKSVWVRRLIGKPGVPYNRKLRVRGSSHPNDYETGLSLPAAESNAFRIHLDLPCPDRFTAALTARDSSGDNRIDAKRIKDRRIFIGGQFVQK